MVFGKSIKLFLLDGTPNGRWICEISNWSGVAYRIPRTMIKESENRKELSTPGVYFLFGHDDANDRPLIYIGEAENIIVRLKQHLEEKDNWNETVIFISKGANLNKAHIKYLEHMFYSLAMDCERYTVFNKNKPTKSSVSESDAAELEEFIANAKMIVNVLGHKPFEKYSESQLNVKTQNTVFYITTESGKAFGVQTFEGFVLLKGSFIHKTSSKSIPLGIRRKVEQSRKNGEIKDNILQNDKLFSSSSSAAAFAVGYSVSGPQQWKTNEGKSLKSFEKE